MTKELLKHCLRYNGLAYLVAEVLYENALYMPSVGRRAVAAVSDALHGAVFGRSATPRLLTWKVPLPPVDRPADLIAWLRLQGVEDIKEGDHTFYIAPQPALGRIVPAIVDFYPEQAGFKVLKDLRDPVRARYIYRHPRSLRMLKTVIGAPRDQLVAANYMHALGIGPRVWDICGWDASSTQCTVFVVEHVSGRPPTFEQASAFLAGLEEIDVRSHLRIIVPRWRQSMDFQPPDCNQNLLYSEDRQRVQYVDFQNFALRDRWTWRRETAIGRTWRNAVSFWSHALRDAGVECRGRLVLDLACGGGAKVYASLAGGAAWAVGWTRRDLVSAATARLFALGSTRFDVFATNGDTPLQMLGEVPGRLNRMLPGAVVFCAASDASQLFALPWNALVAVTDSREKAGDLARRMQSLARSHGTDVDVSSRFCGMTESGLPCAPVVLRRRADRDSKPADREAG